MHRRPAEKFDLLTKREAAGAGAGEQIEARDRMLRDSGWPRHGKQQRRRSVMIRNTQNRRTAAGGTDLPPFSICNMIVKTIDM